MPENSSKSFLNVGMTTANIFKVLDPPESSRNAAESGKINFFSYVAVLNLSNCGVEDTSCLMRMMKQRPQSCNIYEFFHCSTKKMSFVATSNVALINVDMVYENFSRIRIYFGFERKGI